LKIFIYNKKTNKKLKIAKMRASGDLHQRDSNIYSKGGGSNLTKRMKANEY